MQINIKRNDYVLITGSVTTLKRKNNNKIKYEQIFIAKHIASADKKSTDIAFHMYENQIKLRGIVNKITDNDSPVVLISLKVYDSFYNRWNKIFVAVYGKNKEIIKGIKPGDIIDLIGNIQTVIVKKQDNIKRKEPLVLQNVSLV